MNLSPFSASEIEEVAATFSGKQADAVRAAFALINESLAQEYWVKGASRRVRASFPGKHNKICSSFYRADLFDAETSESIYRVDFFLSYGPFHMRGMTDEDVQVYRDQLRAFISNEKPNVQAKLLAQIDAKFSVVSTFRRLVEVVKYLDEKRPKPVYTVLGTSPTVNRHLDEIKTDYTVPATMPELKLEETDEGWVSYLEWPEGITFPRQSLVKTSCCQACNHAIRNGYNWVPVIVQSTDKRPMGLWVGSDCARTIFGIESSAEKTKFVERS